VPYSDLYSVAYYLGQYHPLEENDRFWGLGFTEWHNVAKARRLYPGHRQPRLPGAFGFYDLRCPETLVNQITYSHDIGITAFCYWHYWFAGKRLLHRPLDDMLQLNYPNFKFMLGWANESWSGVWHGAADKIMIEQTYNEYELVSHAKLISEYIESGQYLEIEGNYPFVIYKPKLIPNAASYLGELKRLVKLRSGHDLYLIGNWSPGRNGSFDKPADYGLDAAVVTPLGARFKSDSAQVMNTALWRGLRKLHIGPEVRPYRELASTLEQSCESIHGAAHATIVTGWDNTPRAGRRGLVLTGYNKESFQSAIRDAINLELRNGKKLLFVKSWNEWAEGNVLEPTFHEEWSAGEALREVLSADS
jgi:hypothetical protein